MRSPMPVMLVALCFLGTAPSTHGQSGSESAGILRLDPLVVSATRTERSLEDLPVSVSVLSREEIDRSPGRTVDELLRQIPGIQIPLDNSSTVFPLNPSIAMRGIGIGDTATRSLVLVDGIPVNGAFFGNVFWNKIPKRYIERIEIVRGSSASLYGSYAMGGVVNIITRSSPEDSRELKAFYGTDETVQAEGFISQAFGDNLTMNFNAHRFQTDGFKRKKSDERGAVDRAAGSDATSFQSQVRYRVTPSLSTFLRGTFFDQEQDGDTALSERENLLWDIAGGFDLALGDTDLTGRLFYKRENFDTINVTTDADRNSEFVSNVHDTTSDDVGGSLQVSSPLASWPLNATFGVDFRYIDGTNDQDTLAEPLVVDQRIIAEGKQQSVGVFAELSYFPTDRIELLASGRLDYFRDSEGSINTNGVPEEFSNRDFTEFSPRVAVRYQATEALGLRAAGYQGFRAPTLAERYRSFATPTFVGLSNPELKRETLQGVEVGADLNLRGFSGQVNLFLVEVEDFVGSEVVGFIFPRFTVRNQNVAEIRSRGVEVMGRQAISPVIALSLGYTGLDSEVVKGPLDGNEVEGAPNHTVTFGVHYGGLQKLRGDLLVRYVDDQFQDISNEAPMDDHVVVDLSVFFQVMDNMELFGIANNIFDETYVANGFAETIGAPRQLFGGVNLKF